MLSRCPGESFVIRHGGEEIWIEIEEVTRGYTTKVRIGIVAPRDALILRNELVGTDKDPLALRAGGEEQKT